MLVKNVVASITPKVTAQEKATQETPAGDFRSVLSTAADAEVQASEETVQPDAAGQAEATRAAESTDNSCSYCKAKMGVDENVSGITSSSEASDSQTGGYAIYYSWYVRVAGDVGKVESPALQLFHDVAERISSVFLKNDGWSGNPVQALLTGTESVVQRGSGQVGSYLGSLLNATNSGLQSLIQTLNGGMLWPGSSPSSSSSSGSSSSSLASTAFDTSYLTDITLAKLQYGNQSSSSSGASTARPLPRNRMGGQLVMISDQSEKTSSTPGGSEAARLFLEAFRTFVESLKRDEAQKTESKTEADDEAVQAAADTIKA